MLRLSQHEPVARGRLRNVYLHPDDRGLLVKVIRADAVARPWGKWYKFRRRFRQYLCYMREIGEYVAVHARQGGNPPFLQEVKGFVETDMGLGLVVKAVYGEDGALAPSVRSMLRDGIFDDAAERALQSFFRDLLASDVIASDLNGGNVVYAYDRELGHHFVMIDGLGQPNLIPLKCFSRTINRRGKLRRIGKLSRQVAEARAPGGGAAVPERFRLPKRFVRRSRKILWVTACAAAVVFAVKPHSDRPSMEAERSSAASDRAPERVRAVGTTEEERWPDRVESLADYLPKGASLEEDGERGGPWVLSLEDGTRIEAMGGMATGDGLVLQGPAVMTDAARVELQQSSQVLVTPEGVVRIPGGSYSVRGEDDDDPVALQD